MASEAVQQLENTNGRLKDYDTTRIQKTAQAKQMKPNYDRRLKSPIKFNLYFEPNTANAELDGNLDFKVIIAPNTTKKSGSVPTKKRDDYLTSAKQKFGEERFTRKEFQTEFGLTKGRAVNYLTYWVDENQLFRSRSGGTDSAYSFDSSKVSDSYYLDRAKKAFKEKFTRAQYEKQFKVSAETARKRLEEWVEDGQLFRYLSAKGDPLTQYTFDPNQGGKRETEEYNRSKYGYNNPSKDSKVGLEILSKGLRTDSPEPIKATSVNYHQTQARYDSKRPKSKYKDFNFEIARLGHGPVGASVHWNEVGHMQTREENIKWNHNPDNYW